MLHMIVKFTQSETCTGGGKISIDITSVLAFEMQISLGNDLESQKRKDK